MKCHEINLKVQEVKRLMGLNVRQDDDKRLIP